MAALYCTKEEKDGCSSWEKVGAQPFEKQIILIVNPTPSKGYEGGAVR